MAAEYRSLRETTSTGNPSARCLHGKSKTIDAERAYSKAGRRRRKEVGASGRGTAGRVKEESLSWGRPAIHKKLRLTRLSTPDLCQQRTSPIIIHTGLTRS